MQLYSEQHAQQQHYRGSLWKKKKRNIMESEKELRRRNIARPMLVFWLRAEFYI